MGAYLDKPELGKSNESGENAWLMFGVSSVQGYRTSMEDRHNACLNVANQANVDLSFFGIYDGHGGDAVADHLSQMLLDVVLDEAQKSGSQSTSSKEISIMVERHHLENSNTNTAQLLAESASLTTPDSLLSDNSHIVNGFLKTDSLIAQKVSDSGSTAITAFIKCYPARMKPTEGTQEPIATPNETDTESSASTTSTSNGAPTTANYLVELIVANTGDSRAVLSINGNTIAMSVDQKPDDEVERDRIVNAGSYVSFGRVDGMLAVARAFGDYEFKRADKLPATKQAVVATPEVKRVRLWLPAPEVAVPSDESYSFAILACDGLWDVLSNEEAVKFVSDKLNAIALLEQRALQHTDLVQICEQIIDHAVVELSSKDNVSVAIVLFKTGLTHPPNVASK